MVSRAMATGSVTRPAYRPAPSPSIATPLRWLGSFVILFLSALGAGLVHPFELVRATLDRAAWLLTRGLVLVILIHLPFGSFLSMQAYFNATFTEASGAVTILGFIRFVAPFLTSFIVIGLLAWRILGSSEDARATERNQDSHPDEPGLDPSEPGLETMSWLLGGAISGLLFSAVGMVVGSMVGCLLAGAKLSVPWMIFVGLALELFSPRDAWALVIQGAGFAAAAALVCCQEAVWSRAENQAVRPIRAIALALVASQLINAVWFQVAYLAGSPFGPRMHDRPAESSAPLVPELDPGA
jgi:hypothetical protein